MDRKSNWLTSLVFYKILSYLEQKVPTTKLLTVCSVVFVAQEHYKTQKSHLDLLEQENTGCVQIVVVACTLLKYKN